MFSVQITTAQQLTSAILDLAAVCGEEKKFFGSALMRSINELRKKTKMSRPDLELFVIAPGVKEASCKLILDGSNKPVQALYELSEKYISFLPRDGAIRALIIGIFQAYSQNCNWNEIKKIQRNIRLRGFDYSEILNYFDNAAFYVKDIQDYTIEELDEHFSFFERHEKDTKRLRDFMARVLAKDINNSSITECKALLIDFLMSDNTLYYTKANKICLVKDIIHFILYPMQVTVNASKFDQSL